MLPWASLMFHVARLDPHQNVPMTTALPDADTWLLAYIDGLDTIRRIPVATLDNITKEGSPQHCAFAKAYKSLNLLLHWAKTIVNSFSFKFPGGRIDGMAGTLDISHERQFKRICESFRLLSLPSWSSSHLAQVVGISPTKHSFVDLPSPS